MQIFNPEFILDDTTGSNLVDIVTAPTDKTVIIRDLFLIVDLNSTEQITVTPSRLDVTTPGLSTKTAILWTKRGNAAYRRLDQFLLFNYATTYREKLLPYLTFRDEFVLSPNSSIALSVGESTPGRLQSGDRLRVFGELITTSDFEWLKRGTKTLF